MKINNFLVTLIAALVVQTTVVYPAVQHSSVVYSLCPCLNQFGGHETTVSIDDKTTRKLEHNSCCGYYALFFACCAVESGSRQAMLDAVKDRKAFDEKIKNWAVLVGRHREMQRRQSVSAKDAELVKELEKEPENIAAPMPSHKHSSKSVKSPARKKRRIHTNSSDDKKKEVTVQQDEDVPSYLKLDDLDSDKIEQLMVSMPSQIKEHVIIIDSFVSLSSMIDGGRAVLDGNLEKIDHAQKTHEPFAIILNTGRDVSKSKYGTSAHWIAVSIRYEDEKCFVDVFSSASDSIKSVPCKDDFVRQCHHLCCQIDVKSVRVKNELVNKFDTIKISLAGYQCDKNKLKEYEDIESRDAYQALCDLDWEYIIGHLTLALKIAHDRGIDNATFLKWLEEHLRRNEGKEEKNRLEEEVIKQLVGEVPNGAIVLPASSTSQESLPEQEGSGRLVDSSHCDDEAIARELQDRYDSEWAQEMNLIERDKKFAMEVAAAQVINRL